MKILGISLSQFHDISGFQLVQSIPQVTVLSKQQFNLCSDLILPREEWCGRLLALEFKDEYFLVVKPLLSKNQDKDKTYKRQKYIYSISLLVSKQDYLDQAKQPLYKETVSKIANFFKILEETNHIVYHHQKYCNYIQTILTNIFQDINQKGFCYLTYQCSYFTFINVNRAPNLQSKVKINYSSVPITLLSEKEIDQIQSPFARQLLKYAYKGVFTFKKICKIHSDRKQADIKSFYEIPIKKGLVFMLDMINLSNVYVITAKITHFIEQNSPGRQELSKIAKVIKTSPEELTPEELLAIYLQFTRVSSLNRLIQINRKQFGKLDIFKLVRMGQIYGFLVRSHQKIAYSDLPAQLILGEPLKKWLAERDSKLVISERFEEEMENTTETVKKYLNLNMTIDEMMVNLDVDYERLLSLLNPDNRFVLQINDE